MSRRPSDARRRGVVSLVAVVAVLTGCAQIPTSGPIEQGEEVRAAADGAPVRVLPRDPVVGQSPEEVVVGFLDASASPENDHEVARRFLTPEAAEAWDPDAGVTVVDDNPGYRLERGRGVVRLEASQVAAISADGAYTPVDGREIDRVFGMEKVGDSWRISQVPQGLILDRIEVSLSYRAFEINFFNPSGTLLVPDPVYLPLEQLGNATSLVQSLLDGPTRWLRPAVQSMIPAGTSLVVDAVPVENGVARVDLSSEFLEADVAARERAAAQITTTLMELAGTVTGVAISVEGSPLQLPSAPSVLTADTWATYESSSMTPALGGIFTRGGVVRRLEGERFPPVEGPLGDGVLEVRDPSQSWDGGTITGLADGRRTLVVTTPFVSARVEQRVRGKSLLPASFDGGDRLWVVDVGGAQPQARVRSAEGAWQDATLPRLPGTLLAFRVSVDGTRVAMIVQRGSGASRRGELLLARVVQRPSELRVEAPRRVELTLADARDVSWADASTLVVVGGTPGSVLEPTLVNINRTVSPLSSAPQVGVTHVVAAPGMPLLADTPRDGIWQGTGSDWIFVTAGRDPAYPG